MEPRLEIPARVVHLALAAILVLAIGLRLSGIGSMLPQVAEPDSVVLHNQVEHLERGDPHPEQDFTFGYYPLLFARLTALVSDPAPADPPASSLAEHLARASDAHLRPRIVVAWLSVLIVPATFLLARRFLSRGASLLAAAFMATSTLHLWFAQQARPHAASAAFALIAVLAALNLRRRDRAVDWIAGGLAFGLAVGALESGLLAAGSFAAALLLREPGARRRSVFGPLLALALAGLCVWGFYPFLFVASQGRDAARVAAQGGTIDLFGHLIFLDQFRGAGFARVFAALRDYEPWIASLAVAGLVLAAARKRCEAWRDLAVVLAFAVPYLVLFGLYARTYQRFAIPLLPFLCCLAAHAVARASFRLPPAAAAAVVALLVLPQAWLAARLNAVRRAPDTIERAAAWVEAQLPPGADRILLLPTIDLPLPSTATAIEESAAMSDNENRPWFRYQRRLADAQRPRQAWDLIAMPLHTDELRARASEDPAGYLRGLRGAYAVIEVYGPGRRPPVLGAIRRGLEEIADRVERISPDEADPDEDLPIAWQDDEFPRTNVWAWRAARAQGVGPVIEIWRMREGR